jgi:transcriptional regulator with XRE-family HTH domain
MQLAACDRIDTRMIETPSNSQPGAKEFKDARLGPSHQLKVGEEAGPSINRRRLRAELRQLREDAGMPQALVAEELDWSVSKLTRVENGAVGISVTDVRALLGLYKAGDQTVDQLVNLARRARERRWWDKYKHYLGPAYQEFIGFEADATALRQLHPTMVPSLLQIEPYIADIMRALALTPIPVERLEKLIEVRLRRQEQVLGGDDPTPFRALIDEAALRRPVGGTAAMRAQLAHLAELQDHPTVSISVLPFSAGPHLGMSGAFQIMDFASTQDQTVLYLENADGSVLMRDDQGLVAQYGDQLAAMSARAVHDAAAVDLVHAIGRELG